MRIYINNTKTETKVQIQHAVVNANKEGLKYTANKHKGYPESNWQLKCQIVNELVSINEK